MRCNDVAFSSTCMHTFVTSHVTSIPAFDCFGDMSSHKLADARGTSSKLAPLSVAGAPKLRTLLQM